MIIKNKMLFIQASPSLILVFYGSSQRSSTTASIVSHVVSR